MTILNRNAALYPNESNILKREVLLSPELQKHAVGTKPVLVAPRVREALRLQREEHNAW
jgi:hypothetical protein